MDSVLEVHPDMKLFVPSSLSKHLIRDLNRLSLGVTIIREEPQEIMPSVHSTGVMGEICEQSVVIDTDEGLVVITGCAYPRVENIAAQAIQMLGKPIFLLMGGFHLMYSDETYITSIIETLKELDVQNVCPTHCSGNPAIEMFKKDFGKRYIQGGVGRVIEI